MLTDYKENDKFKQNIEWIQREKNEFQKLMTYYRCALMEIETKFNVLDLEYSLEHDRNPISTIKTRLKTISSISEKLERRNLPLSVNSIEQSLNDVAGVRVICFFPEDVYTLADAFLNQDDVILIEKKDYIADPKPNGYRSLHIIAAIPIFLEREKRMMKTEIQLRTIAMDFWASLEHQLRYKNNAAFTQKMKNELYDCAEISAALDVKMDTLRKTVLSQNKSPHG